MMVVNGRKLVLFYPVSPMLTEKVVEHGVSHGLSEAGYDIRIKQGVWLFPFRRFRIASTVELFNMPKELVAIVHDKSTWARRGLSVFNTVIEPGWRGHLTLELVYHRWWPLYIPAGAGIAQVLFHELIHPADYSNGKYQDQADAPIPARKTLS